MALYEMQGQLDEAHAAIFREKEAEKLAKEQVAPVIKEVPKCVNKTRRTIAMRKRSNVNCSASSALPSALLFDCDGVLVDAKKDGHRNSFNDTFKEMAESYVEDEVKDLENEEIQEEIVEEEIQEGEENDHPIERVRLTVPITDDPSQPALTFRTWLLGLLSCCILSFMDQLFFYSRHQLYIRSLPVQVLVLPLGRLMAATLPTRTFHVPFTKWSFSLNPGPFNLKEHTLITIFANCGANGVLAVHVITIVKAFYHRSLHLAAAMMLTQTTQLLGYGWVGLFRKYLVDFPYMWWPGNLVQVSLFMALHEREKRSKGGLTRLQFFVIVFITSAAYYVLPGYFFPSLSALSFICWIWKDSITAQQLGSGLNGFGLGSFGLNWATVTIAGLGSPLPTPFYVIVNFLVGFVLFMYVLLPIAYWSNAYEARRFPLLSSEIFDHNGQIYNFTNSFDINRAGEENYNKLYLSVMFAFKYGLTFSLIAATISHVALFEGKNIWQMWKKAKTAVKNSGDVHTRLMKKNYEAVPQWWFHVILLSTMVLSIVALEGFGKQLQLPWWKFLVACLIALFYTFPSGVIQATTNVQQQGLNVIGELLVGFMYQGKPLANAVFKNYVIMSVVQALTFLSDFKLGHYMKIPPKSMFIAQLVGTIVASTVYFGTAWWFLESIENICDLDLLPKGSQWTCPGYHRLYNGSIIFRAVGPLRMFTKFGIYPEMNWFFLIGLLAPAPVWLLSLKFPEKNWIKKIHVPIILAGPLSMPVAKAVHYWCWAAVGIFFNYYVYTRYKGWWSRHTYILSAALDSGTAFMGIILFLALKSHDIIGPQWWGLDRSDHCPLANCPTAPGIVVEGCPVL